MAVGAFRGRCFPLWDGWERCSAALRCCPSILSISASSTTTKVVSRTVACNLADLVVFWLQDRQHGTIPTPTSLGDETCAPTPPFPSIMESQNEQTGCQYPIASAHSFFHTRPPVVLVTCVSRKSWSSRNFPRGALGVGGGAGVDGDPVELDVGLWRLAQMCVPSCGGTKVPVVASGSRSLRRRGIGVGGGVVLQSPNAATSTGDGVRVSEASASAGTSCSMCTPPFPSVHAAVTFPMGGLPMFATMGSPMTRAASICPASAVSLGLGVGSCARGAVALILRLCIGRGVVKYTRE